ncbi:hypothetical protein J2T15_000977 [Paenibacillus harenae]|uniref:Uncharacterized protein n=1 Tax=Paenibacillus harenae TaxID=306543 RepID=A0ABT9TW01_PAEHA|nr:hypothetical protein [Paenibacillus harenae]
MPLFSNAFRYMIARPLLKVGKRPCDFDWKCIYLLEIANRLYYYRFVRSKGIFLKFSVNKRDKICLLLTKQFCFAKLSECFRSSFASQNFKEVKP